VRSTDELLGLVKDSCVAAVPALKREALGPEVSLQALGVDSMYLVSILVEVEDRMGVDLDLLAWFGQAKEGRNDRIEGLVAHLHQMEALSRTWP
jgi:acyl carrier protein